MTPEMKELIDEKFLNMTKLINTYQEATQLSLSHINEQTVKLDRKTEKISDIIQSIILKDGDHYVKCPNNRKLDAIDVRIDKVKDEIKEEIDKINEQNQDVNFFKRNPKLGLIMIIVAVIITQGGITWWNGREFQAEKKKENELIERILDLRSPNEKLILRGGKFIYPDTLTDSIK
jgi:hypothetical protein